MKIRNFQIFFFFLLLWLTCQLLAEAAPEATYFVSTQASSVNKQDSLTIKQAPIPKKITAFDSVMSNAWDSPCKISKSTMNQYLYEDVGDIISSIPGIFLFDLGSAGQSLMFTRHGAATNQAIVYFDGRRLYDPVTGESDLNLLPVGFINEIKMEQKLSNTCSPNGGEILSVKSEKYVDEVPYSQIYHHKAGLGFSDVDFIFGQRIARKMNILVGGDIKSFDGKNNAYVYEHQNFRGKLEYNYSPGWRFEYSILNNNFNRYIPGPLLASGNYSTPNAKFKTKRYDHTLNAYGNLFNSDWQNFCANIYYSDLFSKLTDTGYNLKKENHSRYAGLNFQFIQKFWGQLFAIGGDFEHDRINAADVVKHHLSFGSVFIQDDWEWKEKFGLRLMTNFKVHELYSTNFTGGFSSYYKISNDLKLNLTAKQSLRYPSFLELYADTNFNGNPNLENEIHQKIMAGVENNLLSNLQLKTYVYQKNIRQLIQYQAIDTTVATFQNGGNFQFYGFDFQLDWQPGSKFQLNTILSAIDNKNLYDFPNLQMSGNIQYNNSFFENSLETMIHLESKYIGERKSIVLNPYQYSTSYAKLSPTFVLNATAIFGFGKLKIFLMFENILNEKYQLIFGFPMRERTFHYGVRWEFWN